jgi:hypothetical protein
MMVLALFASIIALVAPAAMHAQAPSSYGTEFVVAIPPNDNQSAPTQALHIMISSPTDTEVTVFDYNRATTKSRSVKANVPMVLRDDNGGTSWGSEVWETEFGVPKAIRISSQKPIAVWVLNSKVVSSDGYMARPLSAWGREYRVMSYYDFKETRPWAGGFMIVANEQTSVRIKLKGADNGARTSGGKKIGDEINVLLQEGEVYLVTGDGTTRGSFDLSGTHVTSDRPIGVIGFHQRTTMPNLLLDGNGRNHMSEMLPPISEFGTSFTTLEFSRVRSNGVGSGDVFRIVSSEDATRWSCSFYDRKTGNLLGKQGGLLSRAGDVADISQTQLPSALVQGLAFWEMDKPSMLMQYSCSSTFDGDVNLDPMMITVQPDRAWTNTALAMTARAEQFAQHRVSMLFRTNINDARYAENMASIRANGSPLLATHVRDNVHIAELLVEAGQPTPTWQGQYLFSANEYVTMAGTVYGNSFVDAYGWGLAGGIPQSETSTGPLGDVVRSFATITLDQRNSMMKIDLLASTPGTSVVITDVLGKVLFWLPELDQQHIVVPVADYPAGLLTVIIRSPHFSWSQTVMIAP